MARLNKALWEQVHPMWSGKVRELVATLEGTNWPEWRNRHLLLSELYVYGLALASARDAVAQNDSRHTAKRIAARNAYFVTLEKRSAMVELVLQEDSAQAFLSEMPMPGSHGYALALAEKECTEALLHWIDA